MTETSISVKEVLEELFATLTQAMEQAEQRRKIASTKCEYYKLEFADGEKHGYEEALKQLKVIRDKMAR